MVSTLLALTVLTYLSPAPAVELSGELTGHYADWGPLQVEALSDRDLSKTPLASSPVTSEGQFQLDLPPETERVFLAIWPEQGGVFPVLLGELPFSVSGPEKLSFPIPSPPSQRSERHQITGPSSWGLGGGLVTLLLFIVWAGRRLLARDASSRADRWIPLEHPPRPGGAILAGILLFGGGLLLYGVFALNEALDLLEHTYFQEAFAGSNPLQVAFSPVVAERAHAPGYAVLLWALKSISTAATWLRTPAVLAAVGSAWVLYHLTVLGTDRRDIAWIAAFLGLMTPLSIRYGRDLTPYSLVGLLSVLSTLFLFRALVSNRRRDWIAFAATGTGGFFLHYFTAFLVLGQAIAVGWLWLRSGRGPFWSKRLRSALLWFGVLGALPLLWSAQVVRAFIISAQDNLITHAVYPPAPDFGTYLINHLRVLLGLPLEVSWLVWPLLALLIAGYVLLLRDRPVFARVLLVPFVLVLGLLTTTYLLHSYAYGGRIYYGWRWLRPYVPALAIPMAYAVFHIGRHHRFRLALAALLVLCTGFTGVQSATRWERPAQKAAADVLLSNASDGDAIAVLPAAFYTVGWSYYLHQEDIRHVHAGPSTWQYYPQGDRHVRVFGPIRSFGVPIETFVGHVDIRRLWIAVFNENIFGQPEFAEDLPAHVLSTLDERLTRVKRWRFPFMDLILYTVPLPQLWQGEGAGGVEVDVNRLYRSIRWLPDALDPDYLFEVSRGKKPVRIRLPAPTGTPQLSITIRGAPEDARASAVRVRDRSLRFEGNTWQGDIVVDRSDYVDVTLERDPEAMKWPLKVVIRP